MAKLKIKGIIRTSVISAFTFAAALIWKDVTMDVIEFFVPKREEIYYKLMAAILATLFITIAILLLIKTEYEAEVVIERIYHTKKKNSKKKKKS